MDESQARLLFKGMSLEQCIKMWNESLDLYTAYGIHSIDDDYWWEWLSKHVGGFRLVSDLLSSGDRFNLTDMYFFYDEECDMFESFSTKQEFLDAVGEEFFINEIRNRK
jgi:hypothetical protein